MLISARDQFGTSVKIPLTADCFHVDPENCDSLIVDSPAIIEAFTMAVGCSPCELSGEVSLDIDPWSDGYPFLYSEAVEDYSFAWLYFDGFWNAAVALTDEEIDLVLLSAYPVLKRSEEAESFAEAVELERWKSQQVLIAEAKRRPAAH